MVPNLVPTQSTVTSSPATHGPLATRPAIITSLDTRLARSHQVLGSVVVLLLIGTMITTHRSTGWLLGFLPLNIGTTPTPLTVIRICLTISPALAITINIAWLFMTSIREMITTMSIWLNNRNIFPISISPAICIALLVSGAGTLKDAIPALPMLFILKTLRYATQGLPTIHLVCLIINVCSIIAQISCILHWDSRPTHQLIAKLPTSPPLMFAISAIHIV